MAAISLSVLAVMTLAATFTHGAAAGHSHSTVLRAPPRTATLRDKTDLLSLHRMVKSSPQHHAERGHTTDNTTQTLEDDASVVINTIMHRTGQAPISSIETHHRILHSEEDLADLTKNTNSIHSDSFSASVLNGDIAIPYESLGWFSKTVEVAMDGSLFIGVAIGIMFIAASLLSGAVGLFGDTCLICSFIGYANVAGP